VGGGVTKQLGFDSWQGGNFSLRHRVHTGFAAHPSCNGYRGYFLAGEAAGA
jgi:hypothetical protein